ncbi:MAG: 3-oxoacyl-[acyl-carrier-protein] synthase III C-terminal domain-containing protein [Pseudomonadota bacterium]
MNASIAPERVKLLGSGSAFPGPKVSTATLIRSLASFCSERQVKLARSLAQRLGIEYRHLSRDLCRAKGQAKEGCSAPALCATALRSALAQSQGAIEDVTYLIGHTASPHTLLPPNISWVSEEIDFNGAYMELRQACTGFANALQIASAFVRANRSQAVAIVGSETGSPFFTAAPDFTDIEQLVNFVQMGDGAGAVVIGPDDGNERHVISDIFTGQIGNGKAPGLQIAQGGSAAPYCNHNLPVFEHKADRVRTSGPALFEHGMEAIESRGYKLSDFRYIIPHQANGRMAGPLASRLGVPEEKIYVVADQFGNMGSAAMWVALDNLRKHGDLNPGDRVLSLGAEATKFMYGGFVYTH